MSKGPKAKYIIVLLLTISVSVVLLFAWYSFGNHSYYKHRDLALMACRNGDMEAASSNIQIAIDCARDGDLITEGQHYRLLIDRGICEE